MATLLPNKAHLLPREVEDFLGISRATLYRHLKNGVIPAVKIGILYRIPRDEFMKKYAERHNGTA